ncbi:MAG: serine/threonine-protein kinase [Thermoleophilia bacterium]
MRPLGAGARIAPGYVVAAHLRRGHDLDVYEVWSEERDCPCVAKTPRPDRLASRPVRARLRAEGRALLSLAHPNLVRAYELVERPRPTLVLETLEGETLAHLAGRRRLAAADVAELGLQLCSAVAYLHRHGLLHLDLKPSNVVCDRGLARLLDLSVARAPGRCPAGWGTPGYLAPEQARGGRVDERTDVWGLGAVLASAATGEPPVRQPSRRLPRTLAQAIAAALDPDPRGRPALAQLRSSLLAAV